MKSLLPQLRHYCRAVLLSRNKQAPSRSLAFARIPLRHFKGRQQPPAHHVDLNASSRRSFHLPNLSSLLPSSANSSSNKSNSDNTVVAARILPYAPEPLFKVISSVESYAQFLPFLTASTVTARDPQTHYPTQAFLTVGYGPLTETFTSEVRCDKNNWVVEAKSGARFADGKMGAAGAAEAIFEFLNTKWTLRPISKAETKVDLEISLEFRSSVHAMMLGAVKQEMAGIMIEAFEKRIQEIGT